MHWCHSCQANVDVTADESPRCTRCDSDFVEEVEADNGVVFHEHDDEVDEHGDDSDFDDEYDDEEEYVLQWYYWGEADDSRQAATRCQPCQRHDCAAASAQQPTCPSCCCRCCRRRQCQQRQCRRRQCSQRQSQRSNPTTVSGNVWRGLASNGLAGGRPSDDYPNRWQQRPARRTAAAACSDQRVCFLFFFLFSFQYLTCRDSLLDSCSSCLA